MPASQKPVICQLDILYEDNHLIAVNKRPSDIVQGDKTGDAPLSETVKEYIKKKYGKPGNVFVGVPHRLDRPVSGVVVFARTGKALSRLNELFRKREVEKTYWAIVRNKPEEKNGKLVHYLKKNEKQNKSYAYGWNTQGSKEAVTGYRCLLSSDNYHLLELTPCTGRHHQIRAQLSEIGCPVKGDIKYGDKRTNKDASIHLHARSIEFIHPVKKEPLIITAAPPGEALWNVFLSLIEKGG